MTNFGVENLYLRCLQGLPTLTLCTLMLIDVVLLPTFADLDLHLVFAGLYYWLMYHPVLISPLAVAIIGLFRGGLTGGPLGLSSIILLAAYGLAIKQRRHVLMKPFIILWGGFIFFIIVIENLEWVTSMILAGSFIEPQSLIFQMLLTMLLYPLLALTLFKVQNWVPRKR